MSRPLSIVISIVLGLALLCAGVLVIRHDHRLPAVSRIAPEGAVHADTTVRFAWHAVPGAVRYRVDVARPDGVEVASAATLGDTTIDVSTLALTRGVDYRWVVTAVDDKGRTSRSAPIAFTLTR